MKCSPQPSSEEHVAWLQRFQRWYKLLQYSLFLIPDPFFSFFFSFTGGFLTLYIPFQLILAFHLLIMQVTTWMLVLSAAFPNLLWVAATKVALFKGHFLINAARTLLWAFNTEVTVSPWIAPPPCSHGWPTVFVLFLRMLWEVTFDGVPLFPSRISIGRGQRRFLAIWAFLIRPRTFLPPRHGSWA